MFGSRREPHLVRARRILVAIAVLSIAACGTTVPVGSRGAAAPGLDAFPVPTPSQPELGGSTTGAPTGGDLGAASGSSGAGSTPEIGTPGSPGAETAGQGPTPRTAAGSPAEVGVFISSDNDRTNAAFGYTGPSADPRRVSDAVFRYINARGGLGGRRAVPVYAYFDNYSSEPISVQENTACALWTQDHKVVVGIAPINHTDQLSSCLQRAGVPLISSNLFPSDDTTFRQFTSYLKPNDFGGTTLIPTLVDTLSRNGFFDPGAKVGIVHMDQPVFKRIDSLLRRTLALRNIVVKTDIEVPTPQNLGEVGGFGSVVQSAVLRMRSEGVTHVFFVDYGGAIGIFFMASAESQQYRPRYALTSYQAPTAALAALVPHAQFENSMGVGWLPWGDVAAAQRPAANAATKLCAQLVRSAGEDPEAPPGVCSTLFLAKAIADTAPSSLSFGKGLAFAAAAERLGSTHLDPATFSTRFGPGRRAGAGTFRAFRFVTACDCFSYFTPPMTAP